MTSSDLNFDGMVTHAKTLQWQLRAVPKLQLPNVVAATLTGLIRTCAEHGIPLSHVMVADDEIAPKPIENRDLIDARVYSSARTGGGRDNYGHMFVFLQQRLNDFRTNAASMARAHDIQLDMISELAAERNKLHAQVAQLEDEVASLKFDMRERDEM